MDHQEVYQKSEVKKIFTQVQEYLKKTEVDLIPEKITSVYDYSRMIPRGISSAEMPEWIYEFGKGNNGWWETRPILLQVMLIPPVVEKNGAVRPAIVTPKEFAIDQLWCVATASPAINTLCGVGKAKTTAAINITQAISLTLGGEFTSGLRAKQSILSPFLQYWSFHRKDLGYQKDSIRKIKSFLRKNRFV